MSSTRASAARRRLGSCCPTTASSTRANSSTRSPPAISGRVLRRRERARDHARGSRLVGCPRQRNAHRRCRCARRRRAHGLWPSRGSSAPRRARQGLQLRSRWTHRRRVRCTSKKRTAYSLPCPRCPRGRNDGVRRHDEPARSAARRRDRQCRRAVGRRRRLDAAEGRVGRRATDHDPTGCR